MSNLISQEGQPYVRNIYEKQLWTKYRNNQRSSKWRKMRIYNNFSHLHQPRKICIDRGCGCIYCKISFIAYALPCIYYWVCITITLVQIKFIGRTYLAVAMRKSKLFCLKMVEMMLQTFKFKMCSPSPQLDPTSLFSSRQ